MGWVKEPIRSSKEIFKEIVNERKWNGCIGNSHCPYEYWADWMRDNYNLTLRQCDESCRMIKTHYNIKEFYYTEMKSYERG